jgi:hypothetical protein
MFIFESNHTVFRATTDGSWFARDIFSNKVEPFPILSSLCKLSDMKFPNCSVKGKKGKVVPVLN